MNVFFEDDGQLKAGTVLADNDASLQVETTSGKRVKVKAAAVLLRFAAPSATTLQVEARALAEAIDVDFLWEVCGDDEFGFAELATDYVGHPPAPVESAGVALALAGAPMYFYKRGKGRYRKAPPEALKAALASVERKRREGEQMAVWVAELAARAIARRAAREVADAAVQARQEHAGVEGAGRGLRRAADESGRAARRLRGDPLDARLPFQRVSGAGVSRKGWPFPPWGELPPLPDLPLAAVRAFSIDDATTTEIDDAFSVSELPDGHTRIGIHIAAPALGIVPGSALDAIARDRLSTVYMPGRKITMLPEDVVGAFTLLAGADRPALSLYVDVAHDGVPVRQETRIERVPVAANLHLSGVSDAFANALPAPDDPPWTAELRVLWKLASHLAAERGKADIARIDYSYYVDWEGGDDGRVEIVPRARGSPLDKLVAELMIHVNNSWGRLLGLARVPGLYRTQSWGKVKMSLRPGEHQGLGLAHYLWASSPLRRYSDLVNQRQILAVVAGERAPYADNDAELFAALADFEVTYAQYAEFQDRMEHYWCLRWLLQEGVEEITATVIRDTLVRFDRIPLVRAPARSSGAGAGHARFVSASGASTCSRRRWNAVTWARWRSAIVATRTRRP